MFNFRKCIQRPKFSQAAKKKELEKNRLSCGRSTFQFWTSNERFQLARLPPKEGRKPPFPLFLEASFLYSKASFSRPSFHKHAWQGQRTSWKAYFAGLQGQPVRLLPFQKLTQQVLRIFSRSLSFFFHSDKLAPPLTADMYRFGTLFHFDIVLASSPISFTVILAYGKNGMNEKVVPPYCSTQSNAFS